MTDHSDVDLTPLATELDALRAENATIKRALKAVSDGSVAVLTVYSFQVALTHLSGKVGVCAHDGTPFGIATAIIKAAEQIGVEVPK